MVSIALDAMGGDHAPAEIVSGACLALERPDLHIFLVGIEDDIKRELELHNCLNHERITICHAPEVIGMAESPAEAFRKKKQSSVHISLTLLKEKKVQGFISAGNTGAVMTAATFILGRLNGIDRPAIATILPSEKGPVVMMDSGSNADCKANHLIQFALMGYCHAKYVLGISEPKVGLLNIGEEKEKGNQLTQAVYPELEKLPIRFIGNVEGKGILHGDADVIICDGFVGNSILKFGEGMAEVFFNFFKTEWKRSFLSKLGLLFLAPGIKRFKKQFNYEESGGAPFLGVDGIAFISHGKSSAYAMKNGILSVARAIDAKMDEQIAKALSL